MHLTIDTVLTVGKGLSVKSEKVEDVERAIARLKFTGLRLDRDQFDELIGRAIGWSTMSFYDELGAPFSRCVLSFPKLALEVTGVIRGVGRPQLKLAQATLGSIDASLADKAVLVSGELSWEAGGDEVSDVEQLLGKDCVAAWSIRDSGQGDLLAAAPRTGGDLAATAARLHDSLSRAGAALTIDLHDGKPPVTIDPAGVLA